MKHLKTFENYEDIKVSEANKIKSLPMFDFYRIFSNICGYFLMGRRTELPVESINIYKKENKKFFLDIRIPPGYSYNDKCDFNYTFDDIKSLIQFLKDYEWYDKKK